MQAVSPCIHAVVVTFYPSPDQLEDLLRGVFLDVARIWLVDNTPEVEDSGVAPWEGVEGVAVLRQGSNVGLATGLNIGIRAALAAGATHVVLNDQDSLPEMGMVRRLLMVMQDLESEGLRVAAVGPHFVDVVTGASHPFQVAVPGKCFYRLAHPAGDRAAIETLTLITSGTLVKAEALLDVGLMRDDFFIDHVDIEWCHRARERGWKLFGTGRARMRQRLGETTFPAWRLGWRQESAYAPVRVYYRVRNFLALCRQHHVSFCWKLRNGLYWIWFVGSHALFGRERLASLRMAGRGLWDGLRAVMGPYRGRGC